MWVLSWHFAWMLVTVLILSALDVFSYELFFVLSVLGLVVVIDLTRPIIVRPRWWSRLRVILVLGLIGFVLVTGRHLAEMGDAGTII